MLISKALKLMLKLKPQRLMLISMSTSKSRNLRVASVSDLEARKAVLHLPVTLRRRSLDLVLAAMLMLTWI